MFPGPMHFCVTAMDEGRRIAEAARADIGRPFRPQGRGDEGLDCLGLALRAMAAADWAVEAPRLALRGHSGEQVLAWLRSAGLSEQAVAASGPGDLLLSFPATRQAHLAIRTVDGFVEANAGLRRVVERPWEEGEGWHSAWRLMKGS